MTALESLASLKVSVIVAFVILWNLGSSVAVVLNGGTGNFANSAAAVAMSVVMFAACMFFWQTARSRLFQETLVAPIRRQNFRPATFRFLAAITGLLTIVCLGAAIAYWVQNTY